MPLPTQEQSDSAFEGRVIGRDPFIKSNQTFPIFLVGSNMHMESLPPHPTD